ncbi:MAG: hypothetical protein HYZ90_06300 [Candidatus Omnitrophica bacterium]|nr:hypothetical protein [Candidatus Omnitrophota bacterium]
MTRHVLLGDPSHFRIRAGANPHTRTRWGRLKRVDPSRALAQWGHLKAILEAHGVRVHLLPPVEGLPGLVFPANAGFRSGSQFYLSNLNPARAQERPHYERAIRPLGLSVRELGSPDSFEGEADFIPLGDPSGDPSRKLYLFTHGKIERQRWVPRWGVPPYRRIYGFRSDKRALIALRGIAAGCEVMPLELTQESHYHGDTVFCPFGPRREFLLAYLEGLSRGSGAALRLRLGERLVALSEEDGKRFAANSFQVEVVGDERTLPVLLMPDGLTDSLYREIRSRGVIPCPVDVSEFLEKGGGAVKCMLLDLGEL